MGVYRAVPPPPSGPRWTAAHAEALKRSQGAAIGQAKLALVRAGEALRDLVTVAERHVETRREAVLLPLHGTTHPCAGCGAEVFEAVGNARGPCPRCPPAT